MKLEKQVIQFIGKHKHSYPNAYFSMDVINSLNYLLKINKMEENTEKERLELDFELSTESKEVTANMIMEFYSDGRCNHTLKNEVLKTPMKSSVKKKFVPDDDGALYLSEKLVEYTDKKEKKHILEYTRIKEELWLLKMSNNTSSKYLRFVDLKGRLAHDGTNLDVIYVEDDEDYRYLVCELSKEEYEESKEKIINREKGKQKILNK